MRWPFGRGVGQQSCGGGGRAGEVAGLMMRLRPKSRGCKRVAGLGEMRQTREVMQVGGVDCG